ncbi:hypothetical protein [Magnetospirillum molischianum]|nr:hypothetical protein [Magnetospirillum molischianum]
MDVDLRLFPIDEKALVFWEHIWVPYCQSVNVRTFPWKAIFSQVRSTPRRFDMAIWDGSFLSGLVVGMASRGKTGPNTNVTIRFLERFQWSGLPMRGHIRGIAIDAAHTYAQILCKQFILLKNPALGAIPLYEKIGFSLVPSIQGCPYYGKRVE